MASTKKELDESLSTIKSLLSRIQCKKSTTLNAPDEASSALGTRLASIFVTGYLLSSNLHVRRSKEWVDKGEEIVESFCSGEINVNCATIQGFFETLVGEERVILNGGTNKTVCKDFLRLWMTLILKCEGLVTSSYQESETNKKSNRFWVLPIALRSYVRLAHKYFMSLEDRGSQSFSIVDDSDLCFIIHLYESLTLGTSRDFLARECINVTFDNIGFASIQFFTPLLSVSVISAPLFTTEQCQESSRFISCLMEKCLSPKMQRSKISMDLILPWLTASIKTFYVSFLSATDAQFTHSALCIGYDWLFQILQLISSFIYISPSVRGDLNMDIIAVLINVALEIILPEYSQNYQNGCLPSIGTILVQIDEIISGIPEMNMSTTLSCKAIFNLEALCLVLIDQESIKVTMEILAQILKRWDGKKKGHLVITGGGHCIGCIFASSQVCRDAATTLISLTADMMINVMVDEPLQRSDCFHLAELFGSHELADDHLKLIEAIPFCTSDDSTENLLYISINNQCEALLLCLSFLHIPSNDLNSKQLDCILKSLGALLKRFPNLGIRCLPVFLASIQKFMNEDNLSNVFKLMGFTCSVLARDPSCAHEIWSLLSTMAELHAPIKTQCMAIRLYALLCDANKRLYGRVCDSIQRHVDHPNAEIRIACAATLCEMAMMDVIRDVSNIIGNIQIFLSDEEHVVVHFAVLSLHHLVMVDELDFSMVIKVLGKKLVKVHDIEAILQLSDCIFEPLVSLLGDGEEGSSSDSESSSESGHEVDLQVQDSVSALIGLAKELSDQSFESSKKKYLGLIYQSLTRYTSCSLGIDEEMIRCMLHSPDAANGDGERYDDLKFIILRGIDTVSYESYEIKSVSQTASRLAMNVMQIEEAALGPTLWKNTKKKKSVDKTFQVPESAKEGSITQEIVGKIGNSLAHINSDRLLKCLQDVSLPASFAKFLEATLKKNSNEKVKESCVDVILGQINIERRSASDRREFLLVSSSFACLSPTTFFCHLGKNGGLKYIRSLKELIPQWTNNVIGESINTLLKICSQEHEILGTKSCMLILLEEIAALLRSQSSKRTMSPSALTNIQMVLIQSFLPTLCSCVGTPCNFEEKKEDAKVKIWNAYFSCISRIPKDMLDSQSFFAFEESEGTSKNIARACAVAFLQKQGKLSSSNFSQLLRAMMWLARQNPENNDPIKQVYWRTAALLSEAGQKMPPEIKKDFIQSLFGILLVNGLDSFCIDQLAIQVAFWDICSSYHHPLLIFQPYAILYQSDIEIKKLSSLLLQESPKMIGSLFRTIGMSDWILNRVIQIVSKLSNDDSSQMRCEKMHLMDVAYLSNDYTGGKLKHAFLTAFGIEKEVESRME